MTQGWTLGNWVDVLGLDLFLCAIGTASLVGAYRAVRRNVDVRLRKRKPPESRAGQVLFCALLVQSALLLLLLLLLWATSSGGPLD